jgi:hypothetical protein
MADALEILRIAPVLSSAAWFLLAIVQVYRDRWHSWTETFFLFSCFFAGTYALGDLFFINADPGNPAAALLAARVSLVALALALHFFLLFSLAYVDRMKRIYWAFAPVTVVVVFLILTSVFQEARPPSVTGTLYIPVYNEVPFAVFFAYVIVYAGVGIWNLGRLYRIVRGSSRALGRRVAGLTVTFSAALVLGLASNGYLGITRNEQIPPPFSTLLIFVAGMAYYTIYPIGRGGISDAIRRFQTRRYGIKAAFLTYADGTLIGSRIRPGEKVIDLDLFGATLDVIQNFMRTSFPLLRGMSLSSIRHGIYTLVMEHTRFVGLTLVLGGVESDHLRRHMRDRLLRFESDNRYVLAKWQGFPADARGVADLLAAFFVDEPLANEFGIEA